MKSFRCRHRCAHRATRPAGRPSLHVSSIVVIRKVWPLAELAWLSIRIAGLWRVQQQGITVLHRPVVADWFRPLLYHHSATDGRFTPPWPPSLAPNWLLLSTSSFILMSSSGPAGPDRPPRQPSHLHQPPNHRWMAAVADRLLSKKLVSRPRHSLRLLYSWWWTNEPLRRPHRPTLTSYKYTHKTNISSTFQQILIPSEYQYRPL